MNKPVNDLVVPTAEEVRGWMGMGVGKYFNNVLLTQMEDLKDAWANGEFTGSTTEETIQKNSEALGKIQQIAEILLTLEEMSNDDED